MSASTLFRSRVPQNLLILAEGIAASAVPADLVEAGHHVITAVGAATVSLSESPMILNGHMPLPG